jgi:hypothetical protein
MFGLLVIGLTLALLLLWFRYSCRLLLNTRASQDHGNVFAELNGLRFPELRSWLDKEPDLERGRQLFQSLNREYHLIIELFDYGAELQSMEHGLERRLLRMDYQMMRAWFAVTHRVCPAAARAALAEMSAIVGHLADQAGERLRCSP